MIIGINGKMGSGKDTVGSIIQYLTSECGDSNSSRHRTYTEFLQKGGGSNLRNFDQHYVSDWEIKKFAGKLKQIASLLTGIPVEQFEDQEFKKSLLGEQWGTVRVNPLNAVPVFEDVQFNELMSVREFLQKLGTEAMRDGLHTNVWVNALFADYKPTDSNWNDSLLKHKAENMFYPNWIITDMRFENELEAVAKHKGITIRVVRHGTILNHHPSETALDGFIMHYEIINNGSIEDLVEKVRKILINENII
jgi:hypothetical protein